MHTDPFLLGPVDALVPLPGIPVAQGVGVVHGRSGGITVGLGGGVTSDVWGTKREYTFAWPLARRAAAERLLTRYLNATRTDLRLIDPFQPNLFGFDASVCGAESRLPPRLGSAPASFFGEPWAAFSAGTAAVDVLDLADLPPAGTALVGTVDSCARWTPTQTAATFYPVQPGSGVSGYVIPTAGRPTTISCYLRGSGSYELLVYHFTTSGLGTIKSTPMVLTAGWQRLSLTTPAGGYSAIAQLSCVTPGSVQTVGWQAEHAPAPTPWTPGGGAPVVQVVKFGDGYRALGYRALELVLREV